jgi:two-component SAPR family response regulator
MPYMNGFELYENIQKIEQSLANRVIVISSMAADVHEFLAKNKLPYMAISFNEEQLKRGINRMLSQSK